MQKPTLTFSLAHIIIKSLEQLIWGTGGLCALLSHYLFTYVSSLNLRKQSSKPFRKVRSMCCMKIVTSLSFTPQLCVSTPETWRCERAAPHRGMSYEKLVHAWIFYLLVWTCLPRSTAAFYPLIFFLCLAVPQCAVWSRQRDTTLLTGSLLLSHPQITGQKHCSLLNKAAFIVAVQWTWLQSPVKCRFCLSYTGHVASEE